MIPCKRPRVTIEAHEVHLAASGRTATYHLVTCDVPGCDFTYDAAVATDAADQATWHRKAHRAAVPDVTTTRGDRGFVATCLCGWQSYDGAETSRQSVEQTLTYHLSNVHGLVTC